MGQDSPEIPLELPQVEWEMGWGGEITARHLECSVIELETHSGLKETHFLNTKEVQDVGDENIVGVTCAVEANQGAYLSIFGGGDEIDTLLDTKSLPSGYTILRRHAIKGSMKVAASGGGFELQLGSDFFGGAVACGGQMWLPEDAFLGDKPVEKEYFFISWVIALSAEDASAVAEQCGRIGRQVTEGLLAQGND